MNNKFNFSSKFRLANIFSLVLFGLSVIFILFKGLNYGIDFKGGTLIELRSNNTDASSIRFILNNMDLGENGELTLPTETKESSIGFDEYIEGMVYYNYRDGKFYRKSGKQFIPIQQPES